jgi:hypothetical protein
VGGTTEKGQLKIGSCLTSYPEDGMMKDFDFLTNVLFGNSGNELLESVRGEIKVGIKANVVNQFVLFGVIGLLSAVAPELIVSIAEKAIASVKDKYADELSCALMDSEDFDAIFAEVQTETMATFEKIQALVTAQRRGGCR